MGLLVLAGYSQARVQLIRRDDTLEEARKTSRFTLSRTDFAKRGRILAADGRPLAQDEESFELRINFAKVPKTDAFFADLSAATGIPASEFSSLAHADVPSRAWKTAMSAEQSKAVQAVKARWRSDGVSIGQTGQREYPLGEAGAGLIGALIEGEPANGLERSQNEVLAGQNGVRVGLVDRTGAFLPMRLDPRTTIRRDGQDLTLTIDRDLQEVASQAIRKAVDENAADQGAAIVMDPKTGDVLAMANWPSFDPSVPGGKGPAMTRTSDLNAATMAVLEPGSTFKILTLAKALDEKVIGAGTPINCPGTVLIGRRRISCDAHGGKRAHGIISPEVAIAKSCNISALRWAEMVGYDGFVGFIEGLGVLKKPNLGLPGEVAGIFNYNEPAKRLQLATLGFGQSINTTPIGLTSAFTMIANDGIRMEPRLIAKIGDQEIPPKVGEQVIGADAADTVLRFMESVIESDAGTGKSLRIPGYRLAGKTGTAQKVNRKHGGGYVSNFVGFVPAENPRAVVLVMVDNPKKGRYYGASVAGPAFVEVARSIIRRYDIPPTVRP